MRNLACSVGFISMGQILSLPMVIVGALMMVWAYKRGHYKGDYTTNEVRNWCETVFRSLSAYRWWRYLIENERTGKRCLTVINADLEYDGPDNNQFPLVTT